MHCNILLSDERIGTCYKSVLKKFWLILLILNLLDIGFCHQSVWKGHQNVQRISTIIKSLQVWID